VNPDPQLCLVECCIALRTGLRIRIRVFMPDGDSQAGF
jgi:hypothetical protein